MSGNGKLDRSLDEILSTQKRGRPQRRASTAAKKAAPVGGIKKNPKRAAGAAGKAAPSKAAGKIGDSKIVVSNMPKDVSEAQIKEYFGQSVGVVKRVELSYGPGGVSRGIATVTFVHTDGASKAFKELNGLLIDNRPVKVEVVVSQADQIPQPKTLSERAKLPNKGKAQPKSAANDKGAGKGGKGAADAAKGKKAPRKGRNSRPTKKTAEELDSEMADYFVTPAGADNTAASAPAAANGDAPMEDEIL